MYESFSVGDASTNYRLTIGTYSGTARDSLEYLNNMAFSTKDRDNDVTMVTVLFIVREAGGTLTVPTPT